MVSYTPQKKNYTVSVPETNEWQWKIPAMNEDVHLQI